MIIVKVEEQKENSEGAASDWICSDCANNLCAACGNCHYCGSATCGGD